MIDEKIYDVFVRWFDLMIYKYMGEERENLNKKDLIYGYKGGAQFLVHKNRIIRYPKRMYKELYNWIMSTPLHDHYSGRFLEWSWHTIWDDLRPKAAHIHQSLEGCSIK
jgi:hypothetical protein